VGANLLSDEDVFLMTGRRSSQRLDFASGRTRGKARVMRNSFGDLLAKWNDGNDHFCDLHVVGTLRTSVMGAFD